MDRPFECAIEEKRYWDKGGGFVLTRRKGEGRDGCLVCDGAASAVGYLGGFCKFKV
jgi:hypothetical protein